MDVDQACKGSDHKSDGVSINGDNDPMDLDPSPACRMGYVDMNVETLERFSKDVARVFFNEFGLISHQINSFNQFIATGLQELFDSLGELVVEPGYDPSKGGGGEWRHATIKYGRVKLERPSFWSDKEEDLNLLPKHARLQNMSYSSKLKAEISVQVM